MRKILVASFALLLGLALESMPVHADLIFESATTVATGAITTGFGGVETDSQFFSGVTFQVNSNLHVTDIGGNFGFTLPIGNNQIFGAIVPVASLSSTPLPADLSSNVLGTTLITIIPGQVQSLSGALSLDLKPGFYSIVFGSGKFGATGSAIAAETLNGSAATSGKVNTFALSQPLGAVFIQAPGARYFVEGTASVPEPGPLALAAAAAAGMALFRRRSHQKTA